MTDLDLIARLEAVSEGSRDLDGDILALRGGELWKRARQRASEPCGAPEDMIVREARQYAPTYTTSVDAALSLVPEGWTWTLVWSYGLRHPGRYGATVLLVPDRSGLPAFKADGLTPALTVCGAALKARALIGALYPHN